MTVLDPETHLVILVLNALREVATSDYSFVMSVRPSVCLEQLGRYWTDFSEI